MYVIFCCFAKRIAYCIACTTKTARISNAIKSNKIVVKRYDTKMLITKYQFYV